MRVEQGQPEGFAPITIVLETKREADLMWTVLNTSTTDVEERSRGYIENCDMYAMWNAFNEVYPTGW